MFARRKLRDEIFYRVRQKHYMLCYMYNSRWKDLNLPGFPYFEDNNLLEVARYFNSIKLSGMNKIYNIQMKYKKLYSTWLTIQSHQRICLIIYLLNLTAANIFGNEFRFFIGRWIGEWRNSLLPGWWVELIA